ncbi:MAG: helix-turn-helix transcriptional regulator [Oscillospiraceae bacterium]|nr:helix-turn-helix transcriptional regulator [Oscillospiraceae bacterium]
MAGKVNNHVYPYVEQVKDLPVFLTGIGGTEYQGYTRRTEGYCWHQILYSANGGGTLKYGSTTIQLTDNCYFFLPANEPHEYYPSSEKWDVRWVAFDGYACAQMLGRLGLTKPVVVAHGDNTHMLKLFDKMFVALRTDKVYGNYTCSGLVYQYIMEFQRLASDKSVAGGADRSDILMPALNYIEEHFREDFPVTVLADAAGITPQYLCRVFRQTMNIRPNEYITRRRLQEAMRLLTDTDAQLSEIALNSGFSDAGYFGTVFKKYNGITPLEYRKANNTKPG